MDQFIWKFAGNSEKLIQYNLEVLEWEIISVKNFPSTLNSINQLDISYSIEKGCPLIKFVFFPWKEENGKIYFCKKAKLEIVLDNQLIEVPNLVSEILNPENLQLYSTTDLEYLILSPDEFEVHAENLKQLHSIDVPIEDQLRTEISYISEIQEFNNTNSLNGGNIKEFIETKIDENPGLKYILIFGDETYFPPIYSGETPSDDYYTSFSGNVPTVATGRIPVADFNDAGLLINKIREYTLNPSSGIWKQKIMLTADDYRKINSTASSEMRHTEYSEDLYEIVKNNAIVETYYGSEYEPVSGEGWITLPELTSDIIEGLNQGAAVINYIGHGTYNVIGDEKILVKDRDLPLINPDQNKNAIWVIGTCSFGHYDGEESMPEALLNNPNGAIGIITTSREVYTGTNIQFLRKIFEQINDHLLGENNHRLGDIQFYAKTNSNSSTYSLFHLFGDPAMKLPFFIKDEFINSEDHSIIQLVPENLDLSISNSSQSYITINKNEYYNEIIADGLSYSILHPGQQIYNNQLNSNPSFLLPIDAPTCESCLQINIFSENENGVNTFDYSPNWSLNENTNALEDASGPNISIFHNDFIINSGDLINIPANIVIQFQDNFGINTFSGLGHEITYKLNDNDPYDITHLYEGISDSTGIIQLQLHDYTLKLNELIIEAWDNNNNKSEKKYTLFFSENEEFKLENVYPFPNPFHDEVEFTFHINEPSDIEILVLDLSGKQIFEKEIFNIQPGFIRTEKWDGITSNGAILSNGAYFFTVKATSKISGKSIQKLQKIAKVN